MRYITAEDYQPHWRSKINTVVFSKKSRWSDNSYWFFTAGQVAELLHTNVPETTGQLTPLCQADYSMSIIPKGMLNISSVSHVMPD